MNVLITGAGGFIGSHLVDSQLAKGNKVSAFDLHTGDWSMPEQISANRYRG
jgi:nucleoside-diphosphate-sugar epimerase